MYDVFKVSFLQIHIVCAHHDNFSVLFFRYYSEYTLEEMADAEANMFYISDICGVVGVEDKQNRDFNSEFITVAG